MLPTAFSKSDREAVYRAITGRRDIRTGFTPDLLPDEVLTRLLAAAHAAPSVGLSKPWDFLVIRAERTRARVHELVRRRQDAYAATLPAARAALFDRLRPDAIVNTPVNVVVTCDASRGGWYTLGAPDQSDGMWHSVAYAIENLWLAARAEGVGVCLIGAFDERELAELLHLPSHVRVVAYLCLGYVTRFPPAPELVTSGWSRSRPLAWAVHHEEFGRRGLPGVEPVHLIAETLDAITAPDAESAARIRAQVARSGVDSTWAPLVASACGRVESTVSASLTPATVIVFAGEPSRQPSRVADEVAVVLNGRSPVTAAAGAVGAELCVVDVALAGANSARPGLLSRRVRASGDGSATAAEVTEALELGVEVARDFYAAGNRCLVAGVLTGRDDGHADRVGNALRHAGSDAPEHLARVLADAGALEIGALTGLLLGAAALRLPVVTAGHAARTAEAAASYLTAGAADSVRLDASGGGELADIVAAVDALATLDRLIRGLGATSGPTTVASGQS